MIGTFSVYASLVTVVATIVFSALAGRSRDARMERNVEYATYATAIVLTVAVAALQLALITLDFSLQYVADYTSSTLSTFYRVGAMWAGQGGSLLLWAWLASLFAAWIVYANRAKGWGLSPYTAGVFAVTILLFAGLVAFMASPFAAATQQMTEGFGLNPLLQDPLQIIHPLALYGGYVLYTVPFAIVVGSLISGEVSGPWLRIANRWSVISWIALTMGIVLGARWAYAELGWGGYWAWDPVENASLLPWLTGTLLLHTGMTYRGLPRLRLASVITVMTTYVLVLFGTFLTRSGVISSVHAFGESNMGIVLGGAIAAIVVACGAIVVWRLPQLRVPDPGRRGHGWLGQLVLLILLTAITVAVLWGTMFPLFNRVVTGQEIAVTPGFFRVVVTPLAVAILGLFAISPLLPNQSVPDRRREIVKRVVVGVLVFGGIMLVTKGANPGVALVLTLGVLAVMTVVWKATPRVKDAYQNDVSPVWGAIRATGPYVGHVGLLVMLAAITMNVAFQLQGQGSVKVGQTVTLGGQVIRLDSANIKEYPDRQSLSAEISLLDAAGGVQGSVLPRLEAFTNSEQLHNEVGILATPARDIYVVIDALSDDTVGSEVLTITVFDNPAVIWIWAGGALLCLGGVLFAIPRRRRIDVNPQMEADVPEEEDDVSQLLDAAIAAAKSGPAAGPQSDAVDELLAKATAISAGRSGGTATQDDVVAFLEQARQRAGGAASASPTMGSGGAEGTGGPGSGRAPTGSGSARPASSGTGSRTGLWIAVGAIAAIILAGGTYVLGHSTGSSVPGISGDLTNTAPAATSTAATVDQAKVAELMAKISSNPNDAASLLALGDLYYAASDYTNSLTFYEKATAVTPKSEDAWIAVAASAYNGGKDAQAFEAWNKVLAINPKNIEAHYGLGFYYLSRTPSDEINAKAEWEKVVAIDPNSEQAKTVKQHLDSLGASPKPSASPS
jgi:cytochrome c-type biogenesis protein CcmF